MRNMENSDLINIESMCCKIMQLSNVIKGYSLTWHNGRIKVVLKDNYGIGIRYVSGSYANVRASIACILHGLEEVYMRESFSD